MKKARQRVTATGPDLRTDAYCKQVAPTVVNASAPV